MSNYEALARSAMTKVKEHPTPQLIRMLEVAHNNLRKAERARRRRIYSLYIQNAIDLFKHILDVKV